MELENKLNLYQIFQQLYTDRPELLTDLLQLENAEVEGLPKAIAQHRYLMGVLAEDEVYIITNILDGQTQTIRQPQGIWTIGRGQRNALTIIDEHLSRHHAAVQHIPTQGFFLHDLQSTNGTFLNHEPVASPIQLREGDRIRIGSTVFSFFCCQETQSTPSLSKELVSYFTESTPTLLPTTSIPKLPRAEHSRQQVQQQDTSILGHENSEESTIDLTDGLEVTTLTSEEQAQVLDRFFDRDEE